jgi:hypothetical protein
MPRHLSLRVDRVAVCINEQAVHILGQQHLALSESRGQRLRHPASHSHVSHAGRRHGAKARTALAATLTQRTGFYNVLDVLILNVHHDKAGVHACDNLGARRPCQALDGRNERYFHRVASQLHILPGPEYNLSLHSNRQPAHNRRYAGSRILHNVASRRKRGGAPCPLQLLLQCVRLQVVDRDMVVGQRDEDVSLFDDR